MDSDQPSRELDARIAELLFDTRVEWATGQYGSRHPTKAGQEWRIPCDGEPYYTSDSENPGGYYLNALPAYSSDWKAMQKVVEKLVESRRFCCMSLRFPVAERVEFELIEACSQGHDGGAGRHYAQGGYEPQTAPLAVCVAALRAFGGLK